MDGNDFIVLAGRLAVMPQDEAAHRTAISRAYYGAFHVARSFLFDLSFRPVGNANVHAFVRHYLGEAGHQESYLAASELAYLQSARNRADYDLNDSEAGSRAYAMVNVERAYRVLSLLNVCREEGARELIRQGIAEYE